MARTDSLSSRVAHAYYKYGCFCSSHPFSALLFSLSSLLFLSYPLTRWPALSPSMFSCTLSDISEVTVNSTDAVAFTGVHKPAAYVQQVIVTANVERPVFADRTVRSNAVKAFLCRLFALKTTIRHFRSSSGSRRTLQDVCVSRNWSLALFDNVHLKANQPCDVLSPLNLWYDNLQNMLDDDDILETMLDVKLWPSCVGDILLGAPRSSLKVFDNCTGQRCTWRLGVTFLMSELDNEFVSSVSRHLATLTGYEMSLDGSGGAGSFPKRIINVHYKSGKTLFEYIPLFLAYLLLFVYLYFSARKIEMVKSRGALAVGAVLTDAFSLSMASGICLHFELTSKLGVAGLFPYLAMLVGMENTLCITRAVVSTPVTLNVKERISHGLSKEGWSITKNFLIQIAVLTVGFFTNIAEIVEFCSFACISYVVDFYMQLFFYAPCLAFDLRRFDPQEKEQLSLLQLAMSSVKLERYPPVKCPFADTFPSLFPVAGADHRLSATFASQDRSKSDECAEQTLAPLELNIQSYPSVFNRISQPFNLRALFRWTRERYFHRIALTVTVMWILWFVLLVNQWQLIRQVKGIFYNDLSSVTNEKQSINLDVLHANIQSSHLDALPDYNRNADIDAGYGTEAKGTANDGDEDNFDLFSYQRQLVPCWLNVLDLRKVADSTRFITVLSPIVLHTNITQLSVDACNANEVVDSMRNSVFSFLNTDQMHMRISWLEVQMTIVLFLSCSIFVTVALFILYVCFVGGGSGGQSWFSRTKNDDRKVDGSSSSCSASAATGQQSVVASLPVVFRGHTTDVQLLVVVKSGLVSCSASGDIICWDPKADECHFRISSDRGASNTSSDLSPRFRRVCDNSETVKNRFHRSVNDAPSVSGLNSDSPTILPVLQFPCSNDDDDGHLYPSVWSMASNGSVLGVGLSNGYLDFFNTETGSLMCSYRRCLVGVTHIAMKSNRVFAARLDGRLDFVELRLCTEASPMRFRPEGDEPLRLRAYRRVKPCCLLVKTFAAHQQQINCLQVCTNYAVTASDDFTLKVYDVNACRLAHKLYGHSKAVVSVLIDDSVQSAYSCSSDGLICMWDLPDGLLIRTIRDLTVSAAPVTLGLTSVLLIGLTLDGSLWIWLKSSMELITRIKPTEDDDLLHLEQPHMAILNDSTVVIAYKGAVQFWDMKSKMMLREVRLTDDDSDGGCAVQHLVAIDAISVACSRGRLVYVLVFPVVRV